MKLSRRRLFGASAAIGLTAAAFKGNLLGGFDGGTGAAVAVTSKMEKPVTPPSLIKDDEVWTPKFYFSNHTFIVGEAISSSMFNTHLRTDLLK